jgi:broad specificity phosphatase PhoE
MDKQIIFIRHGEKTKDDPINLSNSGKLRANELVSYFQNSSIVNKPDIIIAMKQNHIDSSNRPYETIKPLSDAYNITLINPYNRDQVDELVTMIISLDNKNVLICWEHSVIAEITEKLIKKKFNYKHLKLTWSDSPESGIEDDNDYSSMWIIQNNMFEVYKQFDIYSNFMISYSNVKNDPTYSKNLI